MSKKNRQLHIIDVPSFDAALHQIHGCHSEYICVDMTKDRNQNRWLGREFDNLLLFFDKDSKVNGMLAIIGCVKAGGSIVLAYDHASALGYFKRSILVPALARAGNVTTTYGAHGGVADGFQCCLQSVISAHQSIIAVTGCRGTGKSTLLGAYVANIHNNDPSAKVVVTAPMPQAADSLLRSFCAHVQGEVSRETLTIHAPHEVLSEVEGADIIVVDEASSYSRAVIERLMAVAEHTSVRLIMASTVDGYEGTGQSYRLSVLQSSNKNLLALELRAQKRFAEHDAVQRCIQQLFYSDDTVVTGSYADLSCRSGIYVLDNSQLRQHGWTQACFALLKQAHYRTTPNDLESFYDRDAWFVVRVDAGEVVAAMHVLPEGLSQEFRGDSGAAARVGIVNGTRRAKDAFTQQSLIHAYGDVDTDSASLLDRVLRVSRIAVAEQYRRAGVASELVGVLCQHAHEQGYACLSVSFGASEVKSTFWANQGFIPVRLGLHANKANDEYALLMMKSINGCSVVDRVIGGYHRRYLRHVGFFSLRKLAHLPECVDGGVSQAGAIVELVSVNEIVAQIESVIRYHRDINWLLPYLHQVLCSYTEAHQVFAECFLDGNLRSRSQCQQDIVVLRSLLSLVCGVDGGEEHLT